MPEDPSQGDAPPRPNAGRRFFARDLAGWLTSLSVHAVILLSLAWLSFPQLTSRLVPLLIDESDAIEQVEDERLLAEPHMEFDLESLNLAEIQTDSVIAENSPNTPAAQPYVASEDPLVGNAQQLATKVGSSDLAISSESGGSRSQSNRAAVLAAKGGTRASEIAVARGLKWLEEHQNADGSWSLRHDIGTCQGRCGNPGSLAEGDRAYKATLRSGTALALLPFLGAGETPNSGRRKRVVRAGLDALIRLGKPTREGEGLMWTDAGQMYSHALSALALAEAYGLTGDTELGVHAQSAIDYIEYAQDPQGGGWRYSAKQPGDTSVTGWQLIALKSAALAGLETSPRTIRSAKRFLDAAQEDSGARYRYRPQKIDPEGPSATHILTSVGLLCRMYTGWEKSDPRLKEGVEWIAARGPSGSDYYYNYYASQTLFHYTNGEGPLWFTWNERLRDQLIAQQSTRGHERGSWWVQDSHNEKGGRLYATSMAILTLEVYYRYLPIYQASAVDTEFPE